MQQGTDRGSAGQSSCNDKTIQQTDSEGSGRPTICTRSGISILSSTFLVSPSRRLVTEYGTSPRNVSLGFSCLSTSQKRTTNDSRWCWRPTAMRVGGKEVRGQRSAPSYSMRSTAATTPQPPRMAPWSGASGNEHAFCFLCSRNGNHRCKAPRVRAFWTFFFRSPLLYVCAGRYIWGGHLACPFFAFPLRGPAGS